jgi:aspartate 1-decarboxylase
MMRTLMRSKIHRAVVTESNLHYIGSITIDPDLLHVADMMENEFVQVLDIDNGARLETYIIEGAPGSREVCINGAAAHLIHPGDRVIVVAYGQYTPAEMSDHRPTVVVCNAENEPAILDGEARATRV